MNLCVIILRHFIGRIVGILRSRQDLASHAHSPSRAEIDISSRENSIDLFGSEKIWVARAEYFCKLRQKLVRHASRSVSRFNATYRAFGTLSKKPLVGRDPHQRSGFGILMHGADRAAEIGPRQQPIEEPGQHDACGKGDDQRRAHDNYIAEQ